LRIKKKEDRLTKFGKWLAISQNSFLRAFALRKNSVEVYNYRGDNPPEPNWRAPRGTWKIEFRNEGNQEIDLITPNRNSVILRGRGANQNQRPTDNWIIDGQPFIELEFTLSNTVFNDDDDDSRLVIICHRNKPAGR